VIAGRLFYMGGWLGVWFFCCRGLLFFVGVFEFLLWFLGCGGFVLCFYFLFFLVFLEVVVWFLVMLYVGGLGVEMLRGL